AVSSSARAASNQKVDPRVFDRPLQPFAKRDLRRPSEQLARERDVGLALLGIVLGQRLEDDLGGGARQLFDRLGQFEQRELVGVAHVHGVVVPGLGERDQPANEIAHVAEGARLAAVAEDRDRAVRERLAQEGRDRAPIVGAHPRAVGVEDPHDRRVNALLAVVGHGQGLGVALGLVVDAAGPDRVDVTPIGLGLWVFQRVAVHLTGRGDQEACALGLGQAERVVGAVGADLERVQGQPQVVDRRGRRGEVIDEVDRLVHEVGLDDVDPDVPEAVGVAQVLDVGERARLEVVHADDAVSARQQLVAQVRAEEPCASCDQAGCHPAQDTRAPRPGAVLQAHAPAGRRVHIIRYMAIVGASDNDQEEETVAPIVGPDDPRRFTDSGIEIAELYSEADLPEDLDLGEPGEFPYTRGVHREMYRKQTWTMRQYAGYASAKESNERYKYLLSKGSTGLSMAFDLPTQLGLDSDNPRCLGEVGRTGVAIDTIDDMRTAFEGIPLDQVSTSMTIN